ncbi:polysaccharide pyruvyl transferase family protein [Falsirhodobacter deserti]|uniref:polysaccharide pyruvyl transferase family protein n=1 Tax=Falsirhodobacter deserti TaxID=1365611 RepID=UPI000FE32DE5|nr:polysaccharide pyruvyl transferase family protein [Falsirhodobacter deserti]
MSIAVVSIAREYNVSPEMPFDTLYEAIGKNTGNLMFTEAAFRLIDDEMVHVGFGFDPIDVNKRHSCMVIPAANWLNKKSNWDFLVDKLEKLTIPVVVIGLGLQADTNNLDAVEVSPSALRLAQFLGRSSPAISVRGNFTRDWLIGNGITNVVTTGCPSLYMKAFDDSPSSSTKKIVLQSTRYGVNASFVKSEGINRKLFALSAALNLPMVYQSEAQEMRLLATEESAYSLSENEQNLLAATYLANDTDGVDRYMRRNAKVFYNLSEWSKYLRKHKGVIGTRLHGSIIALNSGKPAVLVPHDSRTAEVASFAGIPVAFGPDVRGCQTLDDLNDVLATSSIEHYRDIRSRNQSVFSAFLKETGLKPKASAMY